MNTLIKMLLFSFLLLSFVSCSTMQHNIRKNSNFTEKTISSLLKKNGNVFYIRPDLGAFSIVWTYSEDKIVIYHLGNGKVDATREYLNNKIIDYQIPTSLELDFDISTYCGFVLGGELFGFKIKKESEIQDFAWGFDIECLTNNTFQSDFLNKIVADINTYNMWNVQHH